MKEIMRIALKCIKSSALIKAVALILILTGETLHAQELAIKKTGMIVNNIPEPGVHSPMLAAMELKNELYKSATENSYRKKAKTSLIIGLSLCPPTFLFIQLAKPKLLYERYKIGWGAAAFATTSAMIFYFVRYVHYKNK